MTDNTACTAEQRAEWTALHDRMRDLGDWHDAKLMEAGYLIKHGVEHNTPELAARLAEDHAREAIALWAERQELGLEADAHPFAAELLRSARD